MKTVLPVATVAALALGLSGCAFLPGAGPSITLDAFELEAESLALDLTGVAGVHHLQGHHIPGLAVPGAVDRPLAASGYGLQNLVFAQVLEHTLS